jgi:hypothetical protein
MKDLHVQKSKCDVICRCCTVLGERVFLVVEPYCDTLVPCLFSTGKKDDLWSLQQLPDPYRQQLAQTSHSLSVPIIF